MIRSIGRHFLIRCRVAWWDISTFGVFVTFCGQVNVESTCCMRGSLIMQIFAWWIGKSSWECGTASSPTNQLIKFFLKIIQIQMTRWSNQLTKVVSVAHFKVKTKEKRAQILVNPRLVIASAVGDAPVPRCLACRRVSQTTPTFRRLENGNWPEPERSRLVWKNKKRGLVAHNRVRPCDYRRRLAGGMRCGGWRFFVPK